MEKKDYKRKSKENSIGVEWKELLCKTWIYIIIYVEGWMRGMMNRYASEPILGK